MNFSALGDFQWVTGYYPRLVGPDDGTKKSDERDARMNSEQLFSMALGLQPPWQVESIDFSAGAKGGEELHLTLGFLRGSRFPDGKGQACPVHDTVEGLHDYPLDFTKSQFFNANEISIPYI
jgi:hypothetical protein